MMIALRANDNPLRGMIICLRQNEGRFSPRRKSKLNKSPHPLLKVKDEDFYNYFSSLCEKSYLHFAAGKLSFSRSEIIILRSRSSFDRREIIIRPQGDYSSLTLAAKLLLSFPHKTPSRVPFSKLVRRLRKGARCRPFAYI